MLALVTVGARTHRDDRQSRTESKNKFAMSVLTGGCAALNYPTCNCDLVHRAYKSLQESAGEWFASDSRKDGENA
jgi:hypothetical protein